MRRVQLELLVLQVLQVRRVLRARLVPQGLLELQVLLVLLVRRVLQVQP